MFHTGMRISEFCGLTIHDLDMEKRIIDINKQLQRTTKMEYMIESTKTNAGTRKLPIDRGSVPLVPNDPGGPRSTSGKKMPRFGGYTGFLYLDKNGMPEVAMHWEHRFNHAVSRYNEIYREQLPNITPHICRHTYCSNPSKAGMNLKNAAVPDGSQ